MIYCLLFDRSFRSSIYVLAEPVQCLPLVTLQVFFSSRLSGSQIKVLMNKVQSSFPLLEYGNNSVQSILVYSYIFLLEVGIRKQQDIGTPVVCNILDVSGELAAAVASVEAIVS
jgi:hypothetical protein